MAFEPDQHTPSPASCGTRRRPAWPYSQTGQVAGYDRWSPAVTALPAIDWGPALLFAPFLIGALFLEARNLTASFAPSDSSLRILKHVTTPLSHDLVAFQSQRPSNAQEVYESI
jgi:hypothetical protein